MGDFRRDRVSAGRGSRLGRGNSDREGSDSRGFGRTTSRFGSRGIGRNFGGGPGGGRDRDDRGFGRTGKSRADYEMHTVICDKCGKECEVPFKPTSSKPVYCSDCFKNPDAPRRESPTGEGKSGIKASDLDLINEKLNKIMKALNIKE